MNTDKARGFLCELRRHPGVHPCLVEMFEEILAISDAEEKRLAGIEESIHNLNRRVGEVEAKAFKAPRPAEPEQMVTTDFPPKDERVPEPGDIVEYVSRYEKARVIDICCQSTTADTPLGLTNYRSRVAIVVPLDDPNGQPRNWTTNNLRIADRPPLVPGEPVTHREHPEWGVGHMNDAAERAWFFNGHYEYDLSKLRRDSWHPELHEGKV